MKVFLTLFFILSSNALYAFADISRLENSELLSVAQAASQRVSFSNELNIINVTNNHISQILQHSLWGNTVDSADVYVKKVTLKKSDETYICTAKFSINRNIKSADVHFYACRNQVTREYLNWDLAEFNIHLDEIPN